MKKYLFIIFISSLITQCIFDEGSKTLNAEDYKYTIVSSAHTLSGSSQNSVSSDAILGSVSSSSTLQASIPGSSEIFGGLISSTGISSSTAVEQIDQLSSGSKKGVSSNIDFLVIPDESSQQVSSSVKMSSAHVISASYIKHYDQSIPDFVAKGYTRKRTIRLQIPTYDSMSAVDSIYASNGKVIEVHDLDFETVGQPPVLKNVWNWVYDSLENVRFNTLRLANEAPTDTMVKVRYHYDAYDRLIEKVFVGQGDYLNPIQIERVEVYIFPDQIYPTESLTFTSAQDVKREQQSRFHVMDNLGRIVETHVADQDADLYRTERSYFYVGETNRVDSTAMYGRDGTTVSYASSYIYNADGQLTDVDGSFNDQMCKRQFNAEGLPADYICRVISTDKITRYNLYEYY